MRKREPMIVQQEAKKKLKEINIRLRQRSSRKGVLELQHRPYSEQHKKELEIQKYRYSVVKI